MRFFTTQRATQVMRFMCEATIVDILQYDGWYYNSCPTCPRKICFEHGKLYCDGCTKETGDYIPRYTYFCTGEN